MKPPVIILALVCAALAVALFLGKRGAGTALAEAATNQVSLSNEVSKLRGKLVETQSRAIGTQTNLQASLDRRTAELVNASNRVAQVKAMLAATQEEFARAQSELGARAERIGALENQRDELSRKLEAVPALETQLADVKRQILYATGDRDTLLKESQRLQLENAGLQRKMRDLEFLRLQTAKVEQEIEAAKRLAHARPGSSPDLRRPIVLEDDGTVRLGPASAAPSRQ